MTALGVCPLSGYSASAERVAFLEQKLSSEVPSHIAESMGAIVLTGSDRNGHLGTIGRSLEIARGFTEMAHTSITFEDASSFIYIFDKAAGRYVTHSTRVIRPNGGHHLAAVQEIMDDLEGQASLEEVAECHNVEDITQCLFVSTDLASPGILPTRYKPYGLLAYKTIFGISHPESVTHIFAYMNKYTLRALGRLGIVPDALCGRGDYHIPPMGNLTFEDYQPYVIANTSHNRRVFHDTEYAAQHSRWGAVIANITLPITCMRDNSLEQSFASS